MGNVFLNLSRKYFSDPEGVFLALVLILGFLVIISMGDMLAPVLASIVIAYLLEGMVGKLQASGVKRLPSVMIVFIPFLGFLIFLLLGLLPLLLSQVKDLVKSLPAMLSHGQSLLLGLPDNYPNFVSREQVDTFIVSIRDMAGQLGQEVVSFSLSSITTVFTVLVYTVLLPVLTFFLMKDKVRILAWFLSYLPQERKLMRRIWSEMDQQIGNYVRGKFIEIMIAGVVTYVMFALMGLNYSMLLGALVGLSVIIPYIGAIAVTFPVVLIAYSQWGFSTEFTYAFLGFVVTQALDGYLLVPWLFSEAVNLHPVAIIVAILVFGGLWGLWGVFFAIPLATLVVAIMHCWPRTAVTGSEDCY